MSHPVRANLFSLDTTAMLLVALLILAGCADEGVDRSTKVRQPPLSNDLSHCGTVQDSADLLPPENPPRGAREEFSTDFSRHTVPYAEIRSGGPTKDGIPALESPTFVSTGEAAEWLASEEPVVYVSLPGTPRAYPIQILMWHEIVHDVIGGVPVLVTFCPLCNTAIAFKRTIENGTVTFGTTGRLRHSNLVMYDRLTESWWQQATGEAIAGEFAGSCLEQVPASMISFEQFRQQFPGGKILSRKTGFARDYGRNPYVGYDDINDSPFLYDGPEDSRLVPMARILAVERNGDAVAYPFDLLRENPVVNDTVGGDPIVVIWSSGVASALDDPKVAGGRDVGGASAFLARMGNTGLTFTLVDTVIVDRGTGSHWNGFGESTSGKLAGSQLQPIVANNHFWFSWAVFRPDTRVYQP